MTEKQIKDISEDVKWALQRAETIQEENRFLKRVLKQAVLTHGGTLKVDPELAGSAKADPRIISFGDGKVTLEEIQ